MLSLDFSGNDTRQDLMAGEGSGRTFKLISYFQDAKKAREIAAQEAASEMKGFALNDSLSKAENLDARIAQTTGASTNLTASTGFDPAQRQNFAHFAAMSGRIAA